MFGFILDTLKEPEIITYMDDVKNLESNKGNIGYRKLRLMNVDNIPNLKFEIKNAASIYDNQGFICMLDKNKSIVNRTFISNIKIDKIKNNNVILSGFVWYYPKAWNMKLNNEITEKNIWKTFKKDELQGWLVYALHSTRILSEKENIKVGIDGNDFHNSDGFFCVIGEEINGIGGYFGRNLYALYDCLRGDFGVKSISELTWKNHKRSKKLFKAEFNKILEVFKEYNVKIILD